MNTLAEAKAVVSWLTGWVELAQRAGRRKRHGFTCLSEFVLRHGRAWQPAPLPPDLTPMAKQQCFRNAALLAMEKPNLVYCEGWALGIVPVEHAWCVDERGRVIDPTWIKPPGIEYFGIAFKTPYLFRVLRDSERYGLIDNWHAGWPLLKAKVRDWKHPLNRAILASDGYKH